MMDFNPEALARIRAQSFGDIPRRTARRLPHKPAIIDGDVTLTFAEFDAAVDRTAAALAENGFTPGDRLALLSRNCWQYAVLAFATARAGVVLVPVNFMLTGEEVAYILGHCRATGFVAALLPDLSAISDPICMSGMCGFALTRGPSDPASWLIRVG